MRCHSPNSIQAANGPTASISPLPAGKCPTIPASDGQQDNPFVGYRQSRVIALHSNNRVSKVLCTKLRQFPFDNNTSSIPVHSTWTPPSLPNQSRIYKRDKVYELSERRQRLPVERLPVVQSPPQPLTGRLPPSPRRIPLPPLPGGFGILHRLCCSA